MSNPLTLTVKQAAELLQLCEPKVYALTRRADFPAIRIGRSIRIDRRGLEEWVYNESRREGADGAGRN